MSIDNTQEMSRPFSQILSILKITKPKHFFNFIRSPHNTIRKIKYHYRRVPERDFMEFLANKLMDSSADLDSVYRDYANKLEVWDEIKGKLAIYPNGYGQQMTRELPALYLSVRLLKPNLIVETGVSAGASSAYILEALHDNGKGDLYSIDLPPDNIPEGKESGWIVPKYLRSRWKLLIGDSKEILEPMLKDLKEIDCFLHDSLHTYEHMLWEYNTAWNYVRRGGLLLSHDVGANDAFLDFVEKNATSTSDYRVFHVLGGFLKL
jgi:predicted O-methyltransferase YrrM